LLEIDLEACLHVVTEALVDAGLRDEQADLDRSPSVLVIASTERATAGAQGEGAGSGDGEQERGASCGHDGASSGAPAHPCAARRSLCRIFRARPEIVIARVARGGALSVSPQGWPCPGPRPGPRRPTGGSPRCRPWRGSDCR